MCDCTAFCYGKPGVTPGCKISAEPACQYCAQPMASFEDIGAGGHEDCRKAEAVWHLQHPTQGE